MTTRSLSAKLVTAIELSDLAVEVRRQKLIRAFPEENQESIEERLRAWLLERPGAPHGDGVGVSVSWPRPSHG